MAKEYSSFCDLPYRARMWAYTEIALVSSAFFLYAAALAAIASLIWTKWANLQFEWEFALVVGIIGLLPYLVVAAVIWRVNLSVFGNRVAPEQRQTAAEGQSAIRGQL